MVLSQGEFRMGDRDTREDAMRLATEAAKRNALEQVATYLESVTVVEGTDITKDEIRTYTAGLILVLDQQANLWLDGDRVVVTIDLMSQIDTDEVAQAILAFRENESARHQLATLKNEIDDLQTQLEAANQLLATAVTAEEAQQASLQRQELLNHVQSNAMVSQAWTDWVMVGPSGYPASWGGLPPSYGFLNAARGLYPANPHVDVAQHVIIMPPPAPPQTSQPVTHPALRQPGMRPVPLTLNEISHTTSTMPVHLGNQPTGAHATVPASSARSVRPLQQFLQPPATGVPSLGSQATSPGSRSVRSLQQFLQPPSSTTPPGHAPVIGRLPPTMHQQPSIPCRPPWISSSGASRLWRTVRRRTRRLWWTWRRRSRGRERTITVGSRLRRIIMVLTVGVSPTWCADVNLASDPDAVRNHAEQSFEQLTQRDDHSGLTTSSPGSPRDGQSHRGYSPDQYVIGIGQGDLTKGPIVCQRVSELSARTDLAKQIRIFVKEHMVDRIRERSGKDADQDIELTREEIVQEYLQGVKIIDHHTDEEKKICTATAVMPKSKLQPSRPPNDPQPLAPVMR